MSRLRSSAIRIRSSTEADSPALLALLSELGHPLSAAELADRLSAVTANPDAAVFVAQVADTVCGFIALQIEDYLHMPGRCGQVTAIVVCSEHRGRGIGSALLNHAEAWFRDRGVRRVLVLTASHREGAHQFYAARGYQMTGYRLVKSLD